MLLYKDFAIHNPTKCGTNSLLAMLRKRGAELILPLHDFDRKVAGSRQRILMVRNPFERSRSMYHHCFKYPPMHRWVGEPEAFQEWLVTDAPRIWSDLLIDMYHDVEPHHVFRLEDGLDQVLQLLGLDCRVSHANKSNTTSPYTITNERLIARLKQDEDFFYLCDEQQALSRRIRIPKS